jgi:molybdate transport system substrate-binding protein
VTASGTKLTGISSMATREVLADLAAAYRSASGIEVAIESVGGVDAARRIRAGESFDMAVLSDDVIGSLESESRVVPGTRVAVAASGVAVAVRAGAPLPDIGSGDAVRRALLEASGIGYSTGPSGTHLARLFERWGIAETIRSRIVQAPPGVAVATLVASGQVQIGFQQLSELIHKPGIHVVGVLPPEIQVTTLFSAGVCATSTQAEAARAWLAFIASPESEGAKRRHGMEPPA